MRVPLRRSPRRVRRLAISLSTVALATTAAVSPAAFASAQQASKPEPTPLDSLVSAAEKAFLLEQIARIEPPERVRELAGYGEQQLAWGGGFYGMLPAQLEDFETIDPPRDEASRRRIAYRLARQREENLRAMRKVNPDYALDFERQSLASFLDGLPWHDASESPANLTLRLDHSAVAGFLDALEDSEVTPAEAQTLAELPSNQQMLRHRRELGYVPEPLPDTASLAAMIAQAGSPDPLDRLWCWINPQNSFGYADLTEHRAGYDDLVRELENSRARLTRAAIARIARFAPVGAELDATFALTVGWAIRGWTTPRMAGLNVEQVKDDWNLLVGTMVEESYHRLQVELAGPVADDGPRDFSDLVSVDSGDARYDRLHEIAAYTMLEGCANLVREPFHSADLSAAVDKGAALLARFVDEVVEQGELDRADALINEGLQGNGPLYSLGWRLASLVAEDDGPGAVGELQAQGPVAFFLRAAELQETEEKPLLTSEVLEALEQMGS